MAPRPASRRQPATCSPRLAASRVARMDRNIMRISSWSRGTYCRRSSASCTLRRPSLRVYMLYSCSTSSPESLGASPGCLDRQEGGASRRQSGRVSTPGRQARAGAAGGGRAPGDVLHVPIAPAVGNEAPEALFGPLMDPPGLRGGTRRNTSRRFNGTGGAAGTPIGTRAGPRPLPLRPWPSCVVSNSGACTPKQHLQHHSPGHG